MKYFEYLKRRISVLTAYLVKTSHKYGIKATTNIDFSYKNHFYIFNSWYLDKEEDEALLSLFEDKNIIFFKNLIENTTKYLEILVDFTYTIKNLDVKSKNTESLKEIYLNFIKKYQQALSYSLHLPIIAWEILIKKLEDELEKKIDPIQDFYKFKKYIIVNYFP